MRVAGNLLRVERVDDSAEDEGNHDRDGGAVRIPVADVAAQGQARIIALGFRSCD